MNVKSDTKIKKMKIGKTVEDYRMSRRLYSYVK